MKRRLGYLAASLGWLLLLSSSASAATASPPTTVASNTPSVAISPAIQQLVLSPNQTSASFSVQLYNHTSQSLTFSLSTADFTSLAETGGVAFLGGNLSSLQSQHSLGSFLELGNKTVTVAPNATVTLPITIAQVKQLATGGHYGAILARVDTPQTGQAGNRVSLNQVLSSLVFVETAGQGSKTIKLLPPTIDKLSFSLPSSLNLFFAATGNTQTIPRGVVTIQKGDAPATERGIINVNSSLVLPGSTRLLETSLSGQSHPWLPGVYHLVISYDYDGSLGESTYQASFFYVNILALLVMLVVAVAVVLLVLRLRRMWLKRRHPNQSLVIVTPADAPSPAAELGLLPTIAEAGPEAEIGNETEAQVEIVPLVVVEAVPPLQTVPEPSVETESQPIVVAVTEAAKPETSKQIITVVEVSDEPPIVPVAKISAAPKTAKTKSPKAKTKTKAKKVTTKKSTKTKTPKKR